MRIYSNLFQIGFILTISSIYSVQNQSPTTANLDKKALAKPATSFQIGDLAKNFHSWPMVKMAKKINPWAALQAFANLGFCVAVLVMAIKLKKSNKNFADLKQGFESGHNQILALQSRLNKIEGEILEIITWKEQLNTGIETYKDEVRERFISLSIEFTGDVRSLRALIVELSDSIDRISRQITINSDQRAELTKCVCLITNALQSLELLNLELLSNNDKGKTQAFNHFIEEILQITKKFSGFSYAPRPSTAPRSDTPPIAPTEPPKSDAPRAGVPIKTRFFGGGSRPSTPTAPPTPRPSAPTTPRPGTPITPRTVTTAPTA